MRLLLARTLGVMLTLASARADITAAWDGATANWTESAHWSTNPAFPTNTAPNFYDAIINAGAVTLNQAITINQFALGGSGAIDGTFALTALEGLQWTGGSIRGSGMLTLGAAGSTNISGGLTPLMLSARTINNAGAALFSAGTIRGGNGASISNPSGSTFTMLAGANFFADVASPLYTISNAGTFTARSTAGAGFSTIDAAFTNTGALRVENLGASHTLSLAGGGTLGGTIDLQAGASIELGGNTTLQDGASFTGMGAAVVAGNVPVSGSITAQNLTVSVGELNVGVNSFTVNGAAVQTGGAIRLNGGTFRVNNDGSLRIDDGAFIGAGTLDAGLDSQGVIAPGSPLGTLRINRATTLREDARLQIELGGTSGGTFDVLSSLNAAVLGGALEVSLVNGFTPAPGASFTILTANSVAGVFVNAPLDGQRFAAANGRDSFLIDYTPNSVVLTGFIPEPSAALLALAGAGALLGRRRG